MALTYTAGTSVEGTASVTSTTVTLPTQVAGDYCFIVVSLNAASGIITTPTGWTNILASTAATLGSTSDILAIFYRKWVSGDASTVAITTTSGRVAATPVKVSGADGTTFINTAAAVTQAASGAATVSSPSITPTSVGLVIVLNSRNNTSGAFVTPWTGLTAGVTEIAEASGKATAANNAGHLIGQQTVTSGAATGTKAATPTGTATGGMGVAFAINVGSSAPAFSGPVTLSGAGTLSIGGPPGVSSSWTSSGSGSLAVGGPPALSAAVPLSGSGSLGVAGPPSLSSSASLSGSGTLAGAGGAGWAATVGLGGSGALSASGVQGHAGTVSLSGSGVLSGVGSGGTIAGSAALSGSGSLTILPGALAVSGGVALSGAGNLTTSAIVGFARSVGLSGVGVLSAAGRPNASSSVNLGGVGALVVAVTQAYAATVNLGSEGYLSTRPPIVLLPPQVMLIGVLGVFPLERFQRNGATAGQITSLQSTWNAHDSTWQAEMAEALAQAPDSWVLQQITLGLSGPIPASVTAGWPFGQ